MSYVVLTYDQDEVHPHPIITGPFTLRKDAEPQLDLMNRAAPGSSIILPLISPSPKMKGRARPRRFGKGKGPYQDA